MFEGLDNVNWQNLSHAYGRAEDVPGLIRSLASTDPRERRHAIGELYGSIWHQGTVYEASSHAVPFLIELVQNETVQDRDKILILLSDLAVGRSYQHVHRLIGQSAAGGERLDAREESDPEILWLRRTHTIVGQGIPTFFNCLYSFDPKIRTAAAHALGCFPDRRGAITPAIHAALKKESDAQVRISMALALGNLHSVTGGSPEPDVLRLLTGLMETDPDTLLRVSAAMALARIAREQTSSTVVNLLQQTLVNANFVRDAFDRLPWCHAGIEMEVRDCLAMVRRAGP